MGGYNEDQFRKMLLNELKEMNKNIRDLIACYCKINGTPTPDESKFEKYSKPNKED